MEIEAENKAKVRVRPYGVDRVTLIVAEGDDAIPAVLDRSMATRLEDYLRGFVGKRPGDAEVAALDQAVLNAAQAAQMLAMDFNSVDDRADVREALAEWTKASEVCARFMRERLSEVTAVKAIEPIVEDSAIQLVKDLRSMLDVMSSCIPNNGEYETRVDALIERADKFTGRSK